LVPTIALLLGAPIPFSNLGVIISDLFNVSVPDDSSSAASRFPHVLRTVRASQLNAHQVKRYVSEYVKLSDELPLDELSKLDSVLGGADVEFRELIAAMNTTSAGASSPDVAARFEEVRRKYAQYVVGVRALCRSVWSKFDLVAMCLGGAICLAAFVLNVSILLARSFFQQVLAVVVVYAAGVVVILTYFFGSSASGPLLDDRSLGVACAAACVVILLLLAFVLTVGLRGRVAMFQLSDLFALAVCALHAASQLSNSFIVYEDRLVSFLAISVVLALLVSVVRSSSAGEAAVRGSTVSASRGIRSAGGVLLLAAVLAACLRSSAVFYACREEQVGCETSPFSQPLSAVSAEFAQFKTVRCLLSVASIIATCYAIFRWLRHHGNLNGSAYSVLMMRYAVPLAVGAVCLYWFMDGLLSPNERRALARVVTALPRLVYVLVTSVVVMSVISPLCVYLIPQQSESESAPFRSLPFLHADVVVPQIYNHLRYNWKSLLKPSNSVPSGGENKPPVVYGLATVYSSSLLVPLAAAVVLVTLLVGDNLAPSCMLFAAVIFTLCELHAHRSRLLNRYGKLTVTGTLSMILGFVIPFSCSSVIIILCITCDNTDPQIIKI
jgi:phosphatidylinositol glycan class O